MVFVNFPGNEDCTFYKCNSKLQVYMYVYCMCRPKKNTVKPCFTVWTTWTSIFSNLWPYFIYFYICLTSKWLKSFFVFFSSDEPFFLKRAFYMTQFSTKYVIVFVLAIYLHAKMQVNRRCKLLKMGFKVWTPDLWNLWCREHAFYVFSL